ncbi:MAG: hypothetical protein LBR36_04905 [Bacteroidales bacterium]|jgi:hypothetical protein|nr:hypothetical protein [Bacteroidales bacterium]
MKKVLIAVAAVALMAGFASCEKDCKCTWTVPGTEISGSHTYTADELDQLGTTCKEIKDVLSGYENISCK